MSRRWKATIITHGEVRKRKRKRYVPTSTNVA